MMLRCLPCLSGLLRPEEALLALSRKAAAICVKLLETTLYSPSAVCDSQTLFSELYSMSAATPGQEEWHMLGAIQQLYEAQSA